MVIMKSINKKKTRIVVIGVFFVTFILSSLIITSSLNNIVVSDDVIFHIDEKNDGNINRLKTQGNYLVPYTE